MAKIQLMSMTRSIANSNSLTFVKPSLRFQTFFFNPISHLAIPKHMDGYYFPVNRRLQYLSTNQRLPINIKSKRNFCVYSSVQPGPSLPSGSPSWKSWVVGILMTVALPFFSHKWGPLLKWTKEVEVAVETVENIVDVVEEVAEKVGEVAEEIADDLPEGGKLRNAVIFVENVAKETAKDAHLAGDVIDKVQEIENDVEAFIEPATDNAKEKVVTKEANDPSK